ncbi:MAG: hypothetical protein LBP33_13270 [Candidatus Adiutrix sp.]|jgi:hypothetical protein|nr:hypothetical protein [Candidatus Adiutrix sp.]
MTDLHKHIIDRLAWPCLAVSVIVLFCLDSERAWGKAADGDHQLVTSPQTREQAEPITSGVYGPFSSYYHPSLLYGDEECRLVENRDKVTFKVICFPLKARLGVWLAQASETKPFQAQLAAINGRDDKPVPELTIIFPLADMDQKFLSQNIIKRLLKESSIFDAPCKLTYQLDGQPPRNENWHCSSFLNHFDKYSGQSKLYYELRARPATLLPAAEKASGAKAENQEWYDFFKNLQGRQELNIKLNLNGDLTVESTLNLASYEQWISRLLAGYYTGQSKRQPVADTIEAGIKIFGPFYGMACVVNRYVNSIGYVNGKLLYKDIFLVNCNPPFPFPLPQTGEELAADIEEYMPKWFYKVIDYHKEAEVSGADSELKTGGISVNFNFQGFEGLIAISDFLGPLFPVTTLSLPLTQTEGDLFSSRLIHDTLNEAIQLDIPCTLSYKVDGEPASSENVKCNLFRYISADDINIKINVDYDLDKCLQFADNTCLKAGLIKATSFLKDIKKDPKEIVMDIKFGTGEAITAGLDLANFDLALIDRLFERIETLRTKSEIFFQAK